MRPQSPNAKDYIIEILFEGFLSTTLMGISQYLLRNNNSRLTGSCFGVHIKLGRKSESDAFTVMYGTYIAMKGEKSLDRAFQSHCI